jgi:hypothetical protein
MWNFVGYPPPRFQAADELANPFRNSDYAFKSESPGSQGILDPNEDYQYASAAISE